MALKAIEKYFSRYTAPEVYPWVSEMLRDIQAEVDSGYMKLPVDADGVPIHVGDEMENGEYRGKVTDMSWDGHFWHVYHGSIAIAPCDYTHVKQRTVEDVLCDMIHEYACTDMTTEQTAAKYAAELRDLLEVRDD